MLLNFGLLDDLGLAASKGRTVDLRDMCFEANELGPLVELALMRDGGVANLPGLDSVKSCPARAAAAPLFEKQSRGKIITDQVGAYFVTSRTDPDADLRWTEFLVWAQRAAEKTGIHKRVAQQLVGAIGELEDNIHLHSQAVDTGYVGYRAGANEFEFVVADSGVGILNSLKSCLDYADLKDAGDALQFALQDGVSRYGRAAQRGCGFRPIFVGLANLRGVLRFRSGDHVLVIDGQSPDLTMAQVQQRANLPGFVTSITCRNPG